MSVLTELKLRSIQLGRKSYILIRQGRDAFLAAGPLRPHLEGVRMAKENKAACHLPALLLLISYGHFMLKMLSFIFLTSPSREVGSAP